MTITLPPALAEKVRRLIGTGRFESEADLFQRAFQALDAEDEMLAEIRAKVEAGFAELDQGLGAPLDMNDFMRRADERNGTDAEHAA